MFDVVSQSDFSKGLRWYVICLFCVSILKAVAFTYAQKRTYVYVPCWRFTHLALEVGEKVQARCFPASVRSWGQTQQRDLACHGAEVQYPCYLFCTLGNEQLVAKMACKCLQNIAFHSVDAVFETFRLMDLAFMHFHMQKKANIVSMLAASGFGQCCRWLRPLMLQFQQCALIAHWGWAAGNLRPDRFWGWQVSFCTLFEDPFSIPKLIDNIYIDMLL